jgi:para-nitrobenzyl esterase
MISKQSPVIETAGPATGLDRRRVLIAAAALMAAPSILRAEQLPSEPVVVQTAEGRLRGQRIGDVEIFRGVPYGDTVSGPDRFKPARPAPSWTGVRDAIRLGAPSLQHPTTVYGVDEPAPAEDCLVLNIWKPAGGGRGRPVMFYSHGGGFTTGSAGSTAQDGGQLAREHDVVVVAGNHRLGLLGYLYLEALGGEAYAGSGNQGLSDIVLALKWVKRNIAAFGGDPGNVMMFGESGGGAKTACLYAMPSVAPLFAKAAIQSGPAVRIGTRDAAARTTRLLLAELDIAPGDWRKLLEVPAPRLLAAQDALAKRPPGPKTGGGWRGIESVGPGFYGPLMDGALLPHHPFDPAAPATARDKPLIVGWLDNEAAFFAWQDKDAEAFRLDRGGLERRVSERWGDKADQILRTYRASRPDASPTDLYLAIGSAQSMGSGSIVTAERKAAQGGAPVYCYNLAYRSNIKPPGSDYELGAMHASDIPLVFNTIGPTTTLAGSRPDRAQAAANTSAFFASFARHGRPSAPGQPAWPAYRLDRRATMVIDVNCSVVDDRFGAERKLWEGLEHADGRRPPA